MNLKIHKNIDWLTITWRGQKYPEQVLPPLGGFDLKEKAPAGRFYSAGYKLACGGTFAYSDNPKQGIIVILSGAPLRALREAGVKNSDMVAWALTARNVTRLDYALDVRGGTSKDHSPESIKSAFKRGKVKTRLGLQKSHKDETTAGGRTIEFGAPTSDQRVIVYDKAAEQRALWEAWTRVEMRIKDDRAKALVADMAAHGVEVAGDSKLRKLFNADVAWFQDALSEENIDPREVPNKASNFPKWLHETVYPSVEKHMETDKVAIKAFIVKCLGLFELGT